MILLFTDVSHTPGIGKYAGTYKVATELRKNKFDTQVIDCFKYFDFLQRVFRISFF